MGVVDALESIKIHHEQGHRVALQGIPIDLVLEVIQEEATVVEAGQFIFKNQTRGIDAHILKIIEKIFVFHGIPDPLNFDWLYCHFT